ncbi:MAG TPA: sirohydrochlorin cobaltochelatase [Geopsychrobacteraceae bacterium]|nr:sirohydrochlorin cobaltochelatase [Geopsychrobacteraceae bacterium]
MDAKPEKSAIVIAAFGTSYPSAVDSLLAIVRDIEAKYPETPVQMAFTSNIIRKKWHGRADNKEYRQKHPEVPEYFYRIKNVLGTLADFQDQGYRSIVVQPTLLTHGEEYLDVQAYLEGLMAIDTVKERWKPFERLALGRPLMGSWGDKHPYEHDLQQLTEAVAEDVKLAEQQQAVLLYMGHGNEHLSTGLYYEFERLMNQRYPQLTTIVGLVEGHPDFSETLEKLQKSGRKNVLLKPLMVVAGDHASKDMAGNGADSWSSQLKALGFGVRPIMQGLGDNAAVRALFISHLHDAAAEAGLELR